MTGATDDYDSPWKEAVEQYFPEFIAFYFPAAHAQIDWSCGYDFLDQELRAVVQEAELGKRFGVLPANVAAQIASASVEDIEGWFDLAIEAKRLNDVFGVTDSA